MNMTEKVSKAICNALGDDWDNAPDESSNANLSKQEYKEFAQAAIKAMKEPSVQMMNAGHAAKEDGGNMRSIWKMMIYKALEE